MNEVPQAYNMHIRSKKDNKIKLFKEILQVTVKSNAILVALDGEFPIEM